MIFGKKSAYAHKPHIYIIFGFMQFWKYKRVCRCPKRIYAYFMLIYAYKRISERNCIIQNRMANSSAFTLYNCYRGSPS